MKTSLKLSMLVIAAVCMAAAWAPAGTPDRIPSDGPAVQYGGSPVKAVVDTVTLMGPGGAFPYRGDFETAAALPGGDGQLTDGWTSQDMTAPDNHWHVAAFNNPGTGNGAWCGDAALPACQNDVAGGYGNDWRDILEFRKTVPGDATVRVRAKLRFDTEPGYDYVTLQRRTAAAPEFEPVTGGQGLSWDGQGDVTVDYTFNYTAVQRLGGTDIAVAFVFDSDGAWSDEGCEWPTAGAATVDDLVVTVTSGGVTTYTEDFEDGELGPDWQAVANTGVGDYARVWRDLCDFDPCGENNSNQVAFIELYPDIWILPPPPAGCGMVNNTGGPLGGGFHLENYVRSPAMTLPGGDVDGLTLAFDVYVHELLIANDSPGMFYVWDVRSTAGGDINEAPWVGRDFVYYGGPVFRRSQNQVGDLLVPGATQVQVRLGVAELGWQFGYGEGTNGTSAPYFDNVRVQAYPSAGPRMVITEAHLANDGFPASGTLDLANLGTNSVRFDMASNISARTHQRNDPGDSVVITVSPRDGASLDPPVMHWTLAVRNPLFDPYRTLPSNPITGRVTRYASGGIIENRWNFDLPDTGMLFPGDVLHYYFSATDHRAGDARTSIAPADLTGYGDVRTTIWPLAYTVRCLPTVYSVGGYQPVMLFWNDQGSRGAEDEWLKALQMIHMTAGSEFDVFTTRAPSLGVGNGLGGRATVAQLAGYTDLMYTAGDQGAYTLSNGDFNGDPSQDLQLLNSWLALGNRDMLLCGEDLALSLYTSGTAARTFLESTMGVQFVDGDVRNDIGGQASPTVVAVPGNPVFLAANEWLLHGGCPTPNDFDAILPQPGAQSLALFSDAGGVATPYPYAAALLHTGGPGRVITLPFDLSFVMGWDKMLMPVLPRSAILSDVGGYFAIPFDPDTMVAGVPGIAPALAVAARPNPFNPSVTLRYTLARPGHLTMKVFDARGALVRTLVDGPVAATQGSVLWDGADDRGGQAASGLYFVETRADGQVDVRKVTMLK
ncbi:MAG: hypothetical protein IPP62_15850 [bacterium]|nr:hypothetical protein [bacterium]